jgi:hypothetical protein
VNVTASPLVLLAALKDPPAGLTLQLTPALSLVVAVRVSLWPASRPARRGEIAMEIVPALMVKESVAEAVCARALESVTRTPRERPLAAEAGFPVIAPVDALRESPGGRVPLVRDHV